MVNPTVEAGPDENFVRQAAVDEENNLIPVQKHRDISILNSEILRDIKAGNVEKYFTPDILSNKAENKDLTEMLLKLAEENNANAQNILGVCYITGTNVQVDQEKAIEYLSMAAASKHTVAMRNLAIVLENQGSPDKNKILSLYEQAAKDNDAYALNNLGACYLTGDGVRQNINQAVRNFEKAVKLGDDYALVNLANCYALGNGVIRNEKKAFDLYKKSAEKNNIEGIRNMADCLLKGAGVKQDFIKAMELYKKAGEMGDEKSSQKYAELSEKLVPAKHTDLVIMGEVDKKKKTGIKDVFNLGKKVSEQKPPENTTEKDIKPQSKEKENPSR